MERNIKTLELVAGKTPFRPVRSGELTVMKAWAQYLYIVGQVRVDRATAMRYLRTA